MAGKKARLRAYRIKKDPVGSPRSVAHCSVSSVPSYEDFVRGWRPSAAGKLELVDGIFLEVVEAAKAEPDRPFVLVIEEINRGNPAQIFGEIFTLLEDFKRSRDEAIELAYRREPSERV